MRKKLVAWLTILMMFMTAAGSITAFADTEVDRTPPELKSVSIVDGENITSNTETVQVQVDFIEEGSGLNEVYVTFEGRVQDYYWQGIIGDSYDEDAVYEEPVFTGTHTFDIWIQNHFEVGTHKIEAVTLVDFNGNSVTYNRTDNPELFSSKAQITVTEKKEEAPVTAPVITSFKLSPSTDIDASGTLKATINIKSSQYPVSFISVYLESVKTGYTYSFDWHLPDGVKSGTYSKTFNINNSLPEGKLKISSLYIVYGQEYVYEDTFDIYAFEHPEVFPVPEITVTKSSLNELPLELTGLSVNSKSLKAPAVLKLTMNFNKNGNTPYSADVTFKTDYGKLIKFELLRMKGSGNTYYVEIPMSPFVAEGDLTLHEIYIQEKRYQSELGPNDYQWYDRTEYDFFKNADITLRTEYDIAYFGSLGNSKVLSNVKALKSGETAVLDCRLKKTVPKEMFTAIAGKNITIAFIDDNVQWVFNGRDIMKSKCKDINLYSKLEVVSGAAYGFADKKIALLKFKNNGELPGEAEMRISRDYLAVKYNFPKEDMNISYLTSSSATLEDSNVDIAGDRYYEYEVDHNSTFALSKYKSKIGTTKVTAVPRNLSSIKIKWNKTMGNGYYIYRSTSKSGTYKKIKTITSRKTTYFVDYNVKKGKTYYYKVKPYSKNKTYNKTAKTSAVCKTKPRLKTPTLYTPKKVSGKTQIRVSWSSISWSKANQKSRYNVYRSTSKNGTYKKIATVKGTRSYIDKNVKKGRTYYYKVKAVHVKHSSWSSNMSSIKSYKLR